MLQLSPPGGKRETIPTLRMIEIQMEKENITIALRILTQFESFYCQLAHNLRCTISPLKLKLNLQNVDHLTKYIPS